MALIYACSASGALCRLQSATRVIVPPEVMTINRQQYPVLFIDHNAAMLVTIRYAMGAQTSSVSNSSFTRTVSASTYAWSSDHDDH
jgi:hypothetical protein